MKIQVVFCAWLLSIVRQQSKCASSLCVTHHHKHSVWHITPPTNPHLSLHYLPSGGSATTFSKSLMAWVCSSHHLGWVISVSKSASPSLTNWHSCLAKRSKSLPLTNDLAFALRHCLGGFGDNCAVNQAKKGCSRISFVKRMKTLADEGSKKCLNGGLSWVEAQISYEMVEIPLSSLHSGGATWSKLRWTEVGLRNQKKNRPLTHFLFQAWTRVNPHRWDDVGNSSHLLEQRAFWVTGKMRWVTCYFITFDAFDIWCWTCDTRRQIY